MTVSFTICSANYLPYAKVLGDTLIKHNPAHHFLIVLVDRYKEVDTDFFQPHTVMHAEDMHLSAFEEMNERYNIFELSCALKPFSAEYIFRTRLQCNVVFYFDADIAVYSKFTAAETILKSSPVILTPHLATSEPFEHRISVEKNLLRTGVYNAGFFGLSRTDVTDNFLAWWMERMKDYCFNDLSSGLFVDQLWLNLVPLFFPEVSILNDPGYNVAYWNLGERTLVLHEEAYCVNDKYPLVFFHYSGFIFDGEVLSKHFPEYTFENKQDVIPLFKEYSDNVLNNNRDQFLAMIPQLGKPDPPPPPVVEEIIIIPEREKFFKRKYTQLFGKRNS